MIETPLFQTNFLPDFTQVYLIFETVLVEFNFVQIVPDMDAEAAGINDPKNIALMKPAKRDKRPLLISRGYLAY